VGELERIEDQLRRGWEGGAWHGPAVLFLDPSVRSEPFVGWTWHRDRPRAGTPQAWAEIMKKLAAGRNVVDNSLPGAIMPVSVHG
jgi:hypothetical protein